MSTTDLLVRIWDYFAGVFPPTSVVLLALLIWSEVKGYLTRKRVGIILDSKDVTIKDLTSKTLDAVSGYSRLTGLLERLVQMGDK